MIRKRKTLLFIVIVNVGAAKLYSWQNAFYNFCYLFGMATPDSPSDQEPDRVKCLSVSRECLKMLQQPWNTKND